MFKIKFNSNQQGDLQLNISKKNPNTHFKVSFFHVLFGGFL